MLYFKIGHRHVTPNHLERGLSTATKWILPFVGRPVAAEGSEPSAAPACKVPALSTTGQEEASKMFGSSRSSDVTGDGHRHFTPKHLEHGLGTATNWILPFVGWPVATEWSEPSAAHA